MESLCERFGVTREQYEEEIRRMNEMVASYGFATYNELRDAVIRGEVDVDMIVFGQVGECAIRRSSDVTDAEKRRLARMDSHDIPGLDDETPVEEGPDPLH